jgi:hypothetical protein
MTKRPPFKRSRMWMWCMSAWLPVRRVWAPDQGRFNVFVGDHLATVEYFGG